MEEQPLEVQRVHIHFSFNPVDGWPPVRGEFLWATELDANRYLVDNIPFFALNVSLNDVIEAKPQSDGELEFVQRLTRGGHSTIRIIADEAHEASVQRELVALGCGLEGSNFGGHFAADIPPDVDLRKVLAACKVWLAHGIAEYETADLQR